MIKALSATLLALVVATPAMSQDVVVMRRAIAAPRAPSAPATPKCSVPVQGMWVSHGYIRIGKATSAAGALAVCQAYKDLTKGVCAWERDTQNVDFSTTGSVYNQGHPDLHAAYCS